MIDKVRHCLQRHNLLQFGSRIGVAVSGGADSVFLLHALHELGLAAAVLHVNHQLRGGESEADATFVAELANTLGRRFLLETAPVQPGNVEQEARRARYNFFSTAPGLDAVATGHTQDDQAETLLYRFLRGSGTAGLSGIRPLTSERIIRPLLDLRREEIRAWLHSRGLPWREDSSNLDRCFARNRIRLDLIPALGGDTLAPLLAATAERAQAEEDFWDEEIPRRAAPILQAPVPQDHDALILHALILHVPPFHAEPLAVQRRLLRYAAALVRGNLRGLDFAHIEALRSLFTPGDGSARVQVPGLDAIRSFEWVRFAQVGQEAGQPRNFQTELNVPGRTVLADRGIVIELELFHPGDVYNKRVSALDLDRCSGPLTLRNWRPGDQFRSSGSASPAKVKTLFQEQRIPLWERRDWPVIAMADQLVWARKFGVAADFMASELSSNTALISEHSKVTESKRGFAASIELKRASGVWPRLSERDLTGPVAEVL